MTTHSAIHIIRAELPHLEAVAGLFEGYRAFYRKEPDEAGAREFIRQRLSTQDSFIFLAITEAGTGVGFTQLYPLFTSLRMKKLWLLNDLFVLPEYRGRGISVQLIEQAKELARESQAAGLMLETDKSNQVGNQLYPRTGFVLNAGSNFYVWDCPGVNN